MTFRDCLKHYNPSFPNFVMPCEIPEDWGSHFGTNVVTVSLPFKHFWVCRKLTFLLVPGSEIVIWTGPKTWMCGPVAWLVPDHANLVLLLIAHYHLALGEKAHLVPGHVNAPIAQLVDDLPIVPVPVAALSSIPASTVAEADTALETTMELA
jgi:hypothetical protein